MWFTHVLKTRDADLINVRGIVRGAMILSRDTITAMLVQVKNDTIFNNDIRGRLSDAKDPFIVKLYDRDRPRPIIRMVFALASEQPTARFPVPTRLPADKQADNFTSYDIWYAR
ncbi:hypothetical protein BJV78DRAFT_114669 [Lactifluus subvellereus]|nr:hypothetical protein BJV78DRAFT_114669 [Lactifluus subvellereus]